MSIVLPDGKVCRSLPEQVAENAKNIKKIAEILDGLNIQDNLVAIADISQILTRDELDIVERPVAFIYYSDQLYIKRNEVGGSAFFDIIFSITGSTVLSFNSKEIEVNLSTGALSLTTSTVYTYSKSEIDTLLSSKADISYVDTQLLSKANLSGAAFTGDITAPSIIEDMSGYAGRVSSSLNPNITLTPIYSGAVKNGNKITFCLFAKIETTGSATSNLFEFDIPAAVGQKLFPITFSGSSERLETKNVYCAVDNTNGVSIPIWINKISNTLLRIGSYVGGLTANTEYVFRFECTFLLGENFTP